MTDERLRDAYRAQLRTPDDRAACVSPEDLRRLVERTGPEAERLRTLDHVMACAACRKEFDLLLTVAATRPERRWRPLLAAAAVFLVAGAGVWVALQPRGAPERMRGAVDTVELVTPVTGAVVDSLPVLIWHSFPEAARYTVEILDHEGRPTWTTVTRDTVTAVDVGDLVPGEYRWWVQAVLRDGTQAGSAIRPFRLRNKP